MLIPLSFPPGVYANGTKLQAAGRWCDANLISFVGGAVRPWGGWTNLQPGPSPTPLVGKARAMITWRDNNAADWIAVGTHARLYILNRVGAVADITPVGFNVGQDLALIGGGYGGGEYGLGDYGESGGDPELVAPASVWSLDTFGELLVGVSNADGKAYGWDLDTGHLAQPIAGAPENNRALVVSEQGHLVLLGAGGEGRVVQWSDAQDLEGWTPGPTSEAGSFPLQTGGLLLCGRRTRGGILLLTNQDAWLMSYQGLPLLFAFDQVGAGCGAISQGAVATAGTTLVAWMGRDGFWMFDGDVRPVPCEVSDRVFGEMDPTRISHVTAYHRAAVSEFVWHYCAHGDCDRYVAWNYREGHWSVGALKRTCGADKGAFPHPLAVDDAGQVWKHENGFDYGGADKPFIESGPIQLGANGEIGGQRVFTALDLIPDELMLGDVEATFYGRFYPTAKECAFGPYVARNPTNVRFTTRHLRMRLVGEHASDWRVGSFFLDVQLGGLR